jgi:hypothetical protein
MVAIVGGGTRGQDEGDEWATSRMGRNGREGGRVNGLGSPARHRRLGEREAPYDFRPNVGA